MSMASATGFMSTNAVSRGKLKESRAQKFFSDKDDFALILPRKLDASPPPPKKFLATAQMLIDTN